MKSIFPSLLVLGALFLVPVSKAQQVPALRIGYTDHEILISNMGEYHAVQEELQLALRDSQEALQALYEEFQEKLERYQRQQALISEERRQEREQELEQSQRAIQDRAAESEQDLAQREAELLAPLFEQVDAAIKKIAAEHDLDLVLRIAVAPLQPIILFANEDRITDITLDVAVELGIDVGDESN